MAADGGASATHGRAHSTRKNTEPVSRTAERTSASGSALMESSAVARRAGELRERRSGCGRKSNEDGEASRAHPTGHSYGGDGNHATRLEDRLMQTPSFAPPAP